MPLSFVLIGENQPKLNFDFIVRFIITMELNNFICSISTHARYAQVYYIRYLQSIGRYSKFQY